MAALTLAFFAQFSTFSQKSDQRKENQSRLLKQFCSIEFGAKRLTFKFFGNMIFEKFTPVKRTERTLYLFLIHLNRIFDI